MARKKQDYSFLDLAKEVLLEKRKPLTTEEIWLLAGSERQKKVKTKTQSPTNVLNSTINNSVNKPDSEFCLVSSRPAHWGLKEFQHLYATQKSDEVEEDLQQSDQAEKEDSPSEAIRKNDLERTLHKLLVSYVRNDIEFDNCYVKTIFHERTTGKNSHDTQWTHPDLVGVSYPFTGKGNSYEKGVLELMANIEHSELIFYSFEMKIAITTVNELRNYFFQALSNSNWAHKGYLVAAYYNNFDRIYDEMKELNSTYGIGFIELNIEDYRDSRVLLPAKQKRYLDWSRIDTLYQNNGDFKSFIESVSTNMRNNLMLVQDVYDTPFVDENEFDLYKADLGRKGIRKYKKS